MDVAAPPPAPVRRRWWRGLLAGGLLLAGAFLGLHGWAAWQERSARQALADEQLDLAGRHVDRALRVRRNWPSTCLLAAGIARRRGAYSDAEQYLSRCGPRNRMTEPVRLEWLLLRCERGEIDELAPPLLALVDRNHPESPAILEALAGTCMRQTRYLEALRYLDRWAERAPDSLRALHWRGWVSNQLDHRAQAIGDYERILQRQPGRSVVRQHLAEILLDSSRNAEALPHLERLHEEQPTNPAVLVGLARCRIVLSRTDEARALLEAALEVQPDHFDGLLYRGKLELSAGHLAEAERWLRKASKQKPWDAEARYSLYRTLQPQPTRQQDALAARAGWERIARTQDRLRRLLRTELAANPSNPVLACETGELLLLIGEDQRGLFWLRRALALAPGHAPALRALIAYYERTGNPARAAAYRRQLSPAAPK